MKNSVRDMIQKYGEEVTVHLPGGPLSVMASVQRPVADNLVNDYDLTNYLVFIAYDDLPGPTKFDRMTIRGHIRAVVDPQEERLKNEGVAWVMRVSG